MSSFILPIRFLATEILFVAFIFLQVAAADQKIQRLGSLKLLTPEDITVTIFAKDVPRARHMAFDDQGVLFLSQAKEGELYLSDDFLGVVYRISRN